jgi:DNA-binding NtrC family response regulator
VNSNPLRVLIVDNQADAREWLAEWLRRKHEFDVETACNGVEAIECVAEAQGNYDVVLMDLLLGEGPDGIRTMQEIQGRYPYIETIIITGFGGIEEGVRAMKEGAYRYVLKPLNREELVVYVRHAAERHSLRADLERTAQKHQWLQGLLTVSQALSSRFDLEPTLDIIVAKLQELLSLDTCTIGLFDSRFSRAVGP